MENRKPYVLTIAIAIAIGMFFARAVSAYEVDTHAYLTSEAVELYNKTANSNKITPELKRFMIDGAKHEDDLPRPQNHFYDPIDNDGLSDGFFGGISAKDWANNSKEQGKIEYKLGATTSLAPVDQKKIDAYGKTTDFTWDAGIRYWLNGDKEMAMEVLGHVLHLMEDMGVPEHTRNDSHVNGSAYEKYAGRYEANNPDGQLRTRLGNKNMYTLDSLGDYFDGLARYSNKYFYSPGSIGGYDFPEVDYKNAESKWGKYFITSKDDEDVEYYLSTKPDLGSVFSLGNSNTSLVDDNIKESYWSLLSVRTVRYSAGVIDLFFRDVEKAKNDPSFLKVEQPSVGILGKVSALAESFFGGAKDTVIKAGSFLGSMFNAVGNRLSSVGSFVSGLFTGNDGLTAIGVGGLDDLEELNTGGDSSSSGTAAPSAAAVKKDALAKKNDEITALKMQIDGLQKDAQAQDEALLKLEKKKSEPVTEEGVDTTQAKKIPASLPAGRQARGMTNTPLCAYGSAGSAQQGGVIINEVAWMGGVRSASDEWIELKNVSGNDIDISQWQLLNKSGGIKIRLSDLKSPIVKAGKFILLERTDNNSAVGATADLIYSGALGNTNDGLKLFDGSCGVVDEISVASKWIAGNNDTKQTMERDAYGRGWHTSAKSGGTPKKENSAGVAQSVGGGSFGLGQGGNPLAERQTYLKLLINKVQLAGDSGPHDESVELYNPNDVAVDLTGWYVQKKTGTSANFSTFAKAELFAGMQIDAHGTLMIAHPSSTVAYAVASTYGIVSNNTLVIKDPNRDISDKVGWGDAGDCEGTCAVSPADGQAILRKVVGGVVVDTGDNANDFALTALQILDSGSEAGMTDTQDDNTAGQDGHTAATSTLVWSGGLLDGHVYDLPMDGWLGQRVSFDSGVDIGSIQFGYFNMFVPGSVEVAIFDAQGEQRWTTPLVVPQMAHGGYLTHELVVPLHLVAGDYFIGTRLVSGSIGIRRGIGANPCGVAVHKTGIIPACNNGDDVGMDIWSYAASTTADLAATKGILDSGFRQEADGLRDGMTDTSVGITEGSTSTATTMVTPQFYPVVINEIMYDLPGVDKGREWIEIYNAGTTTVDISEWKFFENETHHGLAVAQGTSSLPAGGYAIIADDVDMFLVDHADFDGVVFNSSFEMNNSSGTLALKNGELVIDVVTYASSTGAGGDGKSLQLFDGEWKAASSTPGALNVWQADVVYPVVTEEASSSDSYPSEISQPVDTAFSYAISNATYQQLIGRNVISAIKTVRVLVKSDTPGKWRGGLCTTAGPCLGTGYTSFISTQSNDVTDISIAKIPLKFDFAEPVVLNPDITYVFYLIAPHNSISRVYGKNGPPSEDSLTALRTIDFDPNGGIGISAMYFVINSANDIEPVIPDPTLEEIATTTLEVVIPPVE